MTDANDTVTTPLPTPGAGPQMRMVEVALIEESLTNPRKHFDPLKMDELADSIKASGVHTPILLRPLPGHRVPDTWGFRRKGGALPAYELVAGARRLRACRMAKVAEIPAMIRELTDAQALEAQVIENLQREDITAMEEAEGFRMLMERNGKTAKEIASEIGKSVRYVYQRMQLLDLIPEAKEAVRAGTLDPSKAREIAAIPSAKLQAKALAYANEKDYRGQPEHNVIELGQWVRSNIMLRMDRARFDKDSAALCPDAGACTNCPKRTGANPDLTSDVGGPDLCIDPDCYHAKEDAHDQAAVDKARKLGGKVVTAAEARELIDSPHLANAGFKGYALLDESAYNLGVIGTTVRKALGKDCPEVTTIIHPRTGEPVAAVKASTAKRIIAERRAAASQKDADHAKAKEARTPVEQRKAYGTRWTEQAADTVAAKISATKPAIPADLLRAVLQDVMANYDEGPIGQALGLPPEFDTGEAEQRLEMLTDDEVPAVFMRWQLYQAMYTTYRISEIQKQTTPRHMLCILADAMGISLTEVQADVKRTMESEDRAREMEAQKPPTPTPPAAQASTPRAKAGAKGKAKNTPAARAEDSAPKTSKEHATAQIAAGLAALEDQDQAPAAQGVETPAAAQPVAPIPAHLHPQSAWPFPDAPAPKQAPAAHGKKASPVADAQGSAAPDGQASADVGTGAASVPGVVMLGAKVKVNATATGRSQKPMIGKTGWVYRLAGPTAWEVQFRGKSGGVAKFVVFDVSELEVVDA